ncbi:hypothetical protein ACQKMV_01100 [Lysinibacillus sp. NPDC094403]|uniref:hypothetical protein n=1 Tax=Lysinibacillus sp. NPDC094403 TaxID=3390581 RepID=UPI003CFF1B88
MNKENMELMESYNNYLSKLQPGVIAVIKSIRNENFNKAVDNLLNLVEGLTWLAAVNNHLQNLGLVKSIDINKLNEINQELVNSITDKDSYLCADILEYGLLDFLLEIEEKVTDSN